MQNENRKQSSLPSSSPPLLLLLNPGFRDAGLRVGELNDIEESIWRSGGLGGDRMAKTIYNSLCYTSISHVITAYSRRPSYMRSDSVKMTSTTP